MTTTNDSFEENFQQYQKKLKQGKYSKEAIKESILQLLKEVSNSVDEESVTPTTTPVANPYIKARNQLFVKWAKDPRLAWKVKEIQAMESGSVPKDRFYDDFVHEVAALGDTF